ncbi:MAG: DUF1684 domain-containing protein [Ferruginibacter sp.]|nr:DUF1684 domain-containing protein [Cytophagales bacterium]
MKTRFKAFPGTLTSLLSAFVLLLSLTNFQPHPRDADPTYEAEIKAWHRNRIASLKSERGWLNLAGLFWLKEGNNTFGSDRENDVVFPKGAAVIGSFELKNGQVSVRTEPGVGVTADGQPVTERNVFAAKETPPPVLQLGSLRWFVIRRGDRYGVRLRDLESPLLTEFKGIETFPIQPEWRVAARLETHNPPKMLTVTDIVGTTSRQPAAGTLVFDVKGKTYRLDATAEGDHLFVVFADETNAEETYGAGRFVYVDQPGADGKTFVDFNKAYNPPCAFTPYATCPLPSKDNRLAIRVVAGEKNYGDH